MKKVLIVITLLLLMTVSIIGCGNTGLTEAQRQTYINMAIEYDNKAAEAQKASDAAWSLCIQTVLIPQKEAYESFAKEKQDLASEYRQQALKYRELAAK